MARARAKEGKSEREREEASSGAREAEVCAKNYNLLHTAVAGVVGGHEPKNAPSSPIPRASHFLSLSLSLSLSHTTRCAAAAAAQSRHRTILAAAARTTGGPKKPDIIMMIIVAAPTEKEMCTRVYNLYIYKCTCIYIYTQIFDTAAALFVAARPLA